MLEKRHERLNFWRAAEASDMRPGYTGKMRSYPFWPKVVERKCTLLEPILQWKPLLVQSSDSFRLWK